MSLSILATPPVASVTLAMFRSETAGPRRSEEPPRRNDGPRLDVTPLADAMVNALSRLGWTPQAPAAAPVAPGPAPVATRANPAPGTVQVTATVTTGAAAAATTAGATEAPTEAPGDAPETAADLPAALAQFAEALMAVLREAGGPRGRGRDRDDDGVRDRGDKIDRGDKGEKGEKGDYGRRAWGYGRAVGVISVRLERVIGELKAELPKPVPAAAAGPVVEVPPAAVVEGAAPATDAAAPPPAAAPVVPDPVEPAPVEPVAIDVAPARPPAPPASPLADAFAQLLDALRDNGAAVPADGEPAAQMIEFLQALARGLKPEGGGTTTVTGLFIRISV